MDEFIFALREPTVFTMFILLPSIALWYILLEKIVFTFITRRKLCVKSWKFW